MREKLSVIRLDRPVSVSQPKKQSESQVATQKSQGEQAQGAHAQENPASNEGVEDPLSLSLVSPLDALWEVLQMSPNNETLHQQFVITGAATDQLDQVALASHSLPVTEPLRECYRRQLIEAATHQLFSKSPSEKAILRGRWLLLTWLIGATLIMLALTLLLEHYQALESALW